MIDVAEVRRQNLARLVALHGLASAARRVGRPDRQVNDMIVWRKSFGEKVARAMEENYAPDLPAGWLDVPHEDHLSRDTDHAATQQNTQLSLSSNTQAGPTQAALPTLDRWPLSEEDYQRFAALPPEGRAWALSQFAAGITGAEHMYPAERQANRA